MSEQFRFDLIDDGWIPCVLPAGSGVRTEELGIRAVLARAHEIVEIAGDTPPETVALHRLLLALLHRVLRGPANAREWERLWQAGRFDMEPIDRYLEKWRERFDLFHPERPFYQVAELPADRGGSIARMMGQADNGQTLFDHTVSASPPAISPARAARLVLAYQSFDTGGRIASNSGGDSALAGTLLQPALTMLRGRTVFETLLLNLQRYEPGWNQQPWRFDADQDRPGWEREPVRADVRPLAGYIDLLTWQARRVRLLPELGGDGRVVVRRAVGMKGWAMEAGEGRQGREPMVAYRKRAKAKPGEEPWIAVMFQEGRALWRDSLALLQSAAGERQTLRPALLDWVGDLAAEGTIERGHTVPVDVLGLRADQGKLLFWRHERLAVPLAYLNDGDLLADLGEALRLVEETGRLLGGSAYGPVRDLAAELVGEGGKLSEYAERLGIESRYWAAVDGPFRVLLARLPADDRDEDGDRPAFEAWREAVRGAARQAFAEGTRGLERAPRSMRAVAAAEQQLARNLARVLGPVRRKEERTMAGGVE